MKPKISCRETGATAVEMALLAPIFLLVLLALVELSLMFFATLTMQYTVREGARFAITGQKSLESNPSNQQRYRAIIQKMSDNSLGFYDKLAPVISVNGKAYSGTAYSDAMFGAAGAISVIKLDCEWVVTTPLLSQFFADGKYHFAVAATMRNEFFP